MFYSVHIRTYSVFNALKFKCLGLGFGLAGWCLGLGLGLGLGSWCLGPITANSLM